MIFSVKQASDLKIGGYVNHQSETLGLDSLDNCFNKNYYTTYPYPINYTFNDLGYREVPSSLYSKNAILVLGDSFTCGLGLPIEYTYPRQLGRLINHQVLNFSLNGASNDWISRKLEILLKYFDPLAVVIHYTFSHRREHPDYTWFDDERTLCDPIPSIDENYSNWESAHSKIQLLVGSLPTSYSFIPNWHQDRSAINQIDFARDYFHYGVKTCQQLAADIHDELKDQI